MPTVVIPAHGLRTEQWQQRHRGGTREDRMLREVTVAVPPPIARLDVTLPATLATEVEDAVRAVTALDATHGQHLGPLATLLLRAESVASSKIEYVEATVDDYARALHGARSNSSATAMVASTRALHELITSVDGGGPLALDAVLRAHAVLMADDPSERDQAGRVRTEQNWIGGSDHSPRGALYVPPPARHVGPALDDLLVFANRDDIGVLTQAAIAHAQFESIHPFTDGNGRIGRALVSSILRRRGATRRTVVPLASAIVARREAYFDALGAYRDGDAGPIVAAFAKGSFIAAVEARTTADRLAELPDRWSEAAGRPRRGSAAARILDTLLDHPVFSADDAEERVGGATSSVYGAINRLHDAGVVRPLTRRTRNQVWVAAAVADELNDLGVRIAQRARLG
ncbi:Fic family protein [Nocardioides sp. ChNu-99]|uniref:Fic family protein n=1 Tax=Nocardioides sp. ChNu-99 TaxID=2839897 RepID=UPI002404E3F3|nr:Fic family protein [Nocardioides sp. ChNu-99]MDF9717254.1 Fic family protein [Nocardioides sp. ChNu-99]